MGDISKHITEINSFNPQNSSKRWAPLFSSHFADKKTEQLYIYIYIYTHIYINNLKGEIDSNAIIVEDFNTPIDFSG